MVADGVLVDVLHDAPDLIWIVDDDGLVVYASDAARVILGRDPHELVGQPAAAVNSAAEDATLDYARRRAQGTRATIRAIHPAKGADGRLRWLETTIRALRTARGRFSVLVTRLAPSPVVSRDRAATAESKVIDGETHNQASATAHEHRLSGYLTDRELQVLRCLGEGLSVNEVGRRLHIRESTVRGHVKCVLQKLQVHSQLQAVLVGMHEGALPTEPSRAGGKDEGV